MSFEKRGVPAAALITEPFRATCETLADLQQMPDYRFVAVEHPITSLSMDELRGRARLAAPFVEAMLVQGVPWPEARTRDASHDAVAALVEDLAAGLRTDGADLYGERSGEHTLALRLHVPDEACAECIMPYETLLPIFERRTRAALGADWSLTLDDPRRA